MNFFKTFWAALLAFVVANILIGVVTVLIFAGLAAAFGDTPEPVNEDSILKIDLSAGITDSPSSSPLGAIDLFSMEMKSSNTILEALNAIDAAAVDENIKGIYINLTGRGSVSASNIEELRNAIVKFKESGKFVVSYSEYYSQFGYYLSSVADKVYLNPEGGLMWQGMASNVMFYKGLLDKLGVQPEVLRHGTFKAAVEPFILDKMSPANREQTNLLIGTIWGAVLHDISVSRGIDSVRLSTYASELAVRSPKDAVTLGMVDSLVYEDQVMTILRSLVEGKDIEDAPVVATTEADSTKADVVVAKNDSNDDDDPEFVSLGRYVKAARPAVKKISKNKVAIVYADGQIIDGKSEEGSVGSQTLAAKLASVRKDKNIKALVLRVNSPGGSALASEIMWREVELIRKVKPVVVSMGSVAASGGYYISAPADIIVANRMTITGSIGVFGLLFNAEKALKDKLGITVDVAKTNPSADLGTPFRAMTAAERAYIMYGIEQVYTTFVGHVAAGRNLSVAAVDSIGGGRVWSGVSAAQNGLIDGFGGIKDAIALAADRAGISGDFRVSQVVDEDDSFTAMIKSLSASVRSAGLKSELGDAYVHYNNVMQMLEQNGKVQARMPYIYDIE